MTSPEWRKEFERLLDEVQDWSLMFGRNLCTVEEKNEPRAALLAHLDATPAAQPIEPARTDAQNMGFDLVARPTAAPQAVQPPMSDERIMALGKSVIRHERPLPSDADTWAFFDDELLALARALLAEAQKPAPTADEIEHDPLCLKMIRAPWKNCTCGAEKAEAQKPDTQAHQVSASVVCGAKTARHVSYVCPQCQWSLETTDAAQLRGECNTLAGILREVQPVIESIVPENDDEAERLLDLRVAIAHAVDPYKREGTLC